jgi:hypothetical protein
MYKVFKIGEKEVAANVTAALPYRYQQVFKEDFLGFIGKEIDYGKIFELGGKILYIANASAEKKDMNKINFDSFLEFLDQFSNGDLVEASDEIVSFALESTKTSVTSKKNQGPQSDQ